MEATDLVGTFNAAEKFLYLSQICAFLQLFCVEFLGNNEFNPCWKKSVKSQTVEKAKCYEYFLGSLYIFFKNKNDIPSRLRKSSQSWSECIKIHVITLVAV